MGRVREVIKEEVKRFLVESMRDAYVEFHEYLDRAGREISSTAASYAYEWQGYTVLLDKSPREDGFKITLSKNGPEVSALVNGVNAEYSIENRGLVFHRQILRRFGNT